MKGIWAQRAEAAQAVLERRFWDEAMGLFRPHFPDRPDQGPFHYWWQAHALDALSDAYKRDPHPRYAQRMGALVQGILHKNDGIINDYYDDMEWMALALLRAHQATGTEVYQKLCLDLWSDIRGGWNDACGGGIAWRKFQPDYKNTPANAPAAILAARLYQRFGNEADLEWAQRIWTWLEGHLIDPGEGLVWDGVNRQGDGQVDRDWLFTYNQGTVVGAALELWCATGEERYMEAALRTAQAALRHLCGPRGVFVAEGGNDSGLFKGILVRYLTPLALEGNREVIEALLRNGEVLWHRGLHLPSGLFGPDWEQPPTEGTDLSAHLSGVMLTEALALLEASGLLW